MLERLGRVDWGRLTHAYGPAEDVPGYLRALTSRDAKTRQNALNSLRATICHQGSRYRASAPAVAFLFELLKAPRTRDRDRIIGLLAELAVGYPDWHIPLGFDPVKAFAPAERLGRRVALDQLRAAEPDEEDDWDPGRQALWMRDAYRAVLRQVGVFQRLTRDADPTVRRAAVKALAWFPEAAAKSAGVVRRMVHDRPDPVERANALLCLGLLGRYRRDRADVPLLRAELDPERPALVRVAAAISLGVLLRKQLPADALAVLLDALQDPEGTSAAGAPLSWSWLGLAAHASEVLKYVRPRATEPVVAALCRAAERVTESMAGADVFWVLLRVVFGRLRPNQLKRDPFGFPRLDPAQLTAAQRRALQAIGRSPVWDQEPFDYGRLMDVGLEYGLPWQPEPYRKFLKAAARSARGGSNA